ncbi:hypothetical protein JOD54_002556 [Actinokineospora baliensis]|uniref:hypothetical protein n=1 Tax=Actinokineospora baliensis TaxID=547056 RepID=UPI0019572E5F|nr:hypothetical protein [Actinokineospora baliensis]MBM7772352.1 hypothetical protein [Actinokineospora baliensis]
MTDADALAVSLATRTGPIRPGGPHDDLYDRMLVYTRPQQVSAVLPHLSAARGGLVLAGANVYRRARKLRDGGFVGPLLIDPAEYETTFATPGQPFVGPTGCLLVPPLSELLDRQRLAGATAVLTPTGYIAAGEVDTLRAAVRQVRALGRDDVIFVVPMDISLLGRAFFAQTKAILAAAGCPIAPILGGQFDPIGHDPKRVIPNLRELAAAVPLLPLRTDFNAFDLMAHGAFAAAIGTGGSVRHTVSPAEKPKSFGGGKDRSPSVLFPELACWWRGSKIATLYGARPNIAARCPCAVCGQRRLTRFTGQAHQNEALAHAVAVWSGWADDMLAATSMNGRAQYWRNVCAGAVHHHEMIATQLGRLEPLEPQKALRHWAELPLWPSDTAAVR